MSSETTQGRTDEQKAALVDRILRGELTPDEACREHGLSDAELKDWVGAYRRTTRQAVEDQLSAALSARGLPQEETPISEFTGSLDSMALAELIQTVEYGRKDAQIRVDHDGEQGQIWCEQGEVIDARSGRLVGSPAFYRLLSLRRGRVYAHFSRGVRARTIHASTPALLLEGAKRYDECQKLRERVGDTSLLYVISPHAWTAEANLDAETWQLLRNFDGQRSLEAVLAASSAPELETLTAIARLLEQQLLTIKPPQPALQWLPLSAQPASKTERSFLPLAASLRARLTLPAVTRRRLWASAAAGAGVVALAFAIGFWSVRREAPSAPAPRRAVASANDWAVATDSGCPAGFAKLAGGPLFAHSLGEPGAPATGNSREPRIGAFCLSRLEATVAEYEACVAAQSCEPAEREYDLRQVQQDPGAPGAADAVALQCNSGQAGRASYPINCVSFQQAQRFCAWRGGRLPSQTEWEHAADEASPDPGEGHKGTLPVGSFPAGGSPEGVLDLLGNVSEWTTSHVGLREGGDARQQLYTVLGGGLSAGASRLGSRASRVYLSANARGRTVGFRCAVDLPGGS
jgi:transposase-like protein